MSTPRRNIRLAQQALELSVAAPQVIAHRVTRMANAGLTPSAGDQLEFMRMSSEKIIAFYQSWAAMWAQAWAQQFKFAQQFGTAWMSAAAGNRHSMQTLLTRTAPNSIAVAAAGFKPIHAQVVSNSKRLARRKKR